MKRAVTAGLLAVAAMVVSAPSASATIHPIVESFDCANEQAFAHHPLGDPADPPGQTPPSEEVDFPGESHSDTSTLRAIEEAIDTPANKLPLGECGATP